MHYDGTTLHVRVAETVVRVDLTPYLHMRPMLPRHAIVDGAHIPLATTYHGAYEGVVAHHNPHTCATTYDTVYGDKRLSTHATAREAAIARAAHSMRLRAKKRTREEPRAQEEPQAQEEPRAQEEPQAEEEDEEVVFVNERTREERDREGRRNAIELEE